MKAMGMGEWGDVYQLINWGINADNTTQFALD